MNNTKECRLRRRRRRRTLSSSSTMVFILATAATLIPVASPYNDLPLEDEVHASLENYKSKIRSLQSFEILMTTPPPTPSVGSTTTTDEMITSSRSPTTINPIIPSRPLSPPPRPLSPPPSDAKLSISSRPPSTPMPTNAASPITTKSPKSFTNSTPVNELTSPPTTKSPSTAPATLSSSARPSLRATINPTGKSSASPTFVSTVHPTTSPISTSTNSPTIRSTAPPSSSLHNSSSMIPTTTKPNKAPNPTQEPQFVATPRQNTKQPEVADLMWSTPFPTAETPQKELKLKPFTNAPTYATLSTSPTMVPTSSPTMVPTSSPTQSVPIANKMIGAGAIAGLVIGAACLGAILGYFALGANKRRKKSKKKDQTSGPTSAETEEAPVTRMVSTDGNDDVSTLGDPLPLGMRQPMCPLGDGTVGESMYSVDYDYTGAYGGVADAISTTDATGVRTKSSMSLKTGPASTFTLPTISSGQSKTNPYADSPPELPSQQHVYSDEASFDQQYANEEEIFEVNVPAGRLGVRISSSKEEGGGGAPMVQAIKESSFLMGRVKIGDRLLSVDGEDVTAMASSEISQLITEKSENPERKLVFVRTNSWV